MDSDSESEQVHWLLSCKGLYIQSYQIRVYFKIVSDHSTNAMEHGIRLLLKTDKALIPFVHNKLKKSHLKTISLTLSTRNIRLLLQLSYVFQPGPSCIISSSLHMVTSKFLCVSIWSNQMFFGFLVVLISVVLLIGHI